mgnify:CR=1 FL=1
MTKCSRYRSNISAAVDQQGSVEMTEAVDIDIAQIISLAKLPQPIDRRLCGPYELLNSVYATNGYFKLWDNDDCLLMSEGVGDGCSPKLVDEVLQDVCGVPCSIRECIRCSAY